MTKVDGVNWFVTVDYEAEGATNSQIIIEGFGPNTISGVVKDVLEGNYPGPDNPKVKGITIGKDSPLV